MSDGDPLQNWSGNTFDLRVAFLAKQAVLASQLGLTAEFTDHGTSIGDASEADWVSMLREFLPGRYGVGPVFVVDCDGRQSEQIDVAIYDRQYAPLWFRTAGDVVVIPAESVYAVFEVKQSINKSLHEYGGKKVASVRALKRTSVPIVHVGGVYPAQDPAKKPILGGYLALRTDWTEFDGDASRTVLARAGDTCLDLGLVLQAQAWENRRGSVRFSQNGTQLISFVLTLFQRLQSLGTALALDVDAYSATLRHSGSASI